MNLIRKAWRWLTTPHHDTTQEVLKLVDAESERKAHLATLPEQPDLTGDPDTDVPAFRPGLVQHMDLTKTVEPGQEAVNFKTATQPSDWDLLSPAEKALFNDIAPHDESKIVRYPAPVELSTADWVSEQLAKAGYSEAYRMRFAGFRRVGVGMSMRHLGNLKARAERKDPTLSVHDLIALRSRGIA